jgi:hypothetical protein
MIHVHAPFVKCIQRIGQTMNEIVKFLKIRVINDDESRKYNCPKGEERL